MELYDGADAVRWYLSGAALDGGYVSSVAGALGGYRSSVEVESVRPRRLNAIRGLDIVYVAGENGVGQGTLRIVEGGKVQWVPPGGTGGVAVTVGNGERKVLTGGDVNRYVVVERVLSDALRGLETVSLVDVFNAGAGMLDVESADAVAGDSEYVGLFLKNWNSEPIYHVGAWLGSCDGDMYFGGEGPDLEGAIQVIGDKYTAPGGVGWTNITAYDEGVSLPVLPGGTGYGVWLKRVIAADTGASGSRLTEVRYQFVLEGETYSGRLRGRWRIAREDSRKVLLFVGQDGAPDFSGAAQEEW